MQMAADYPFMNVLWTMIIFFCWVVWIWMMVIILTDVFRRRDIGGWTKALWVVFLIVLPFLGALVYIIAQHDGMAERNVKGAAQAQQQFDEHIRSVTQYNGAASEIERAKQLLDGGAINQAEFEQLKTKALAAG
jgi:phospholipase D-like protein/putative oligomerization/nucleic acid binding protein